MKIPKTIKIGPHTFQVVFEKDLSGNHNKLGVSNIEKGVIKIDPDQQESQIQDTIIHEILHCINNQVKFVSDDHDSEEAAVSRLTPLLLQVIQDNKELFI